MRGGASDRTGENTQQEGCSYETTTKTKSHMAQGEAKTGRDSRGKTGRDVKQMLKGKPPQEHHRRTAHRNKARPAVGTKTQKENILGRSG